MQLTRQDQEHIEIDCVETLKIIYMEIAYAGIFKKY